MPLNEDNLPLFSLFSRKVLWAGTKLNRRIISSPRAGRRKVERSQWPGLFNKLYSTAMSRSTFEETFAEISEFRKLAQPKSVAKQVDWTIYQAPSEQKVNIWGGWDDGMMAGHRVLMSWEPKKWQHASCFDWMPNPRAHGVYFARIYWAALLPLAHAPRAAA